MAAAVRCTVGCKRRLRRTQRVAPDVAAVRDEMIGRHERQPEAAASTQQPSPSFDGFARVHCCCHRRRRRDVIVDVIIIIVAVASLITGVIGSDVDESTGDVITSGAGISVGRLLRRSAVADVSPPPLQQSTSSSLSSPAPSTAAATVVQQAIPQLQLEPGTVSVACWNFSVGDARQRELYSPRIELQRHRGGGREDGGGGGAARTTGGRASESSAAQQRVHYPNRTDCIHLLTAPPDHRIRLDFRDDFHIEASDGCTYDYLDILDGPFGYSDRIGRFCGRRHPPLIESTGRFLWLHFHSDDSIEYEGFRIVYEFFVSAASTIDRDATKSATSAAADKRTSQPRPVCRIDVPTDVSEGVISSADIPQEILDSANRSGRSVDCTWVFYTAPFHRLFLHWTAYKMTTPQTCVDSFLEIYERTTSLLDRRQLYCDSTPAGGDRRTTTNAVYLRLFANVVERVPQFTIHFTPITIGACDATSQYDCGDGSCIDKLLVCNNRVNCNRSIDELNCTTGVDRGLNVPATVRHHTVIVAVVFAIVLTVAVLAVCATCQASRRERRRLRKLASSSLHQMTSSAAALELCDDPRACATTNIDRRPEVSQTTSMTTTTAAGATGNDVNHRRQESQPLVRTAVLSNGGDHLRRAHDSLPRPPARDVTTVAHCATKSGTSVTQFPVSGTAAKRPTSVFVDASAAASAATAERSAARRKLNEVDRTQCGVAAGVADSIADFAESPLSFNTVISAVATIEKRPVSPLPPMTAVANSAAYSRDTNTPSPRPDVVQDEKFLYPAIANTSSVAASNYPVPLSTQFAPSSSSVDVNSRVMTTNELSSAAGRRVHPGWSASVTPVVVPGSRPAPNPPPRSNHVDQHSTSVPPGGSTWSGTMPQQSGSNVAGDWRMVRRTATPWSTGSVSNVTAAGLPTVSSRPSAGDGPLAHSTDQVAVRSVTAAEAMELCDVRPHSGTHSIVF